MKQTRKRPTVRQCDEGCPCNHTGFLHVLNEGQFKTAKGNKLTDPLIAVLCRGSKGEWISERNGNQSLPVYDPETMTIPGQAKQKQLF